MLYDILIIDDDFSKESDSKEWDDNANKLLCDLIRENLRVTWTTGKLDDLEKLFKKDLSNIQFIFLDLHLPGIKPDDNFKTINGNIMGIFGKINSRIKSEEVTCYINSKHYSKNYEFNGEHDLEKQLNEKFKERYLLEVVKEEKNDLSDTQKDKLIKNNLNVYCKSLIINKHIEVEKIFDDKLELSNSRKEDLNFSKKYLAFQLQKLGASEEHEKLNKRIKLLKEIRNTLAHTEENLNEIGSTEMRKTFWKIISGQEYDKPIEFLKFASLMKYIKSINNLCDALKDM